MVQPLISTEHVVGSVDNNTTTNTGIKIKAKIDIPVTGTPVRSYEDIAGRTNGMFSECESNIDQANLSSIRCWSNIDTPVYIKDFGGISQKVFDISDYKLDKRVLNGITGLPFELWDLFNNGFRGVVFEKNLIFERGLIRKPLNATNIHDNLAYTKMGKDNALKFKKELKTLPSSKLTWKDFEDTFNSDTMSSIFDYVVGNFDLKDNSDFRIQENQIKISIYYTVDEKQLSNSIRFQPELGMLISKKYITEQHPLKHFGGSIREDISIVTKVKTKFFKRTIKPNGELEAIEINSIQDSELQEGGYKTISIVNDEGNLVTKLDKVFYSMSNLELLGVFSDEEKALFDKDKEKIKELENQAKENNKKHQEEIKSLDKKIVKLKNKKKELKDKNKALKKEKSSIKKSLKKTEFDNKRLIEDIDEKNREISEIKRMSARKYDQYVDETQSKMSSLESGKDAFYKQLKKQEEEFKKTLKEMEESHYLKLEQERLKAQQEKIKNIGKTNDLQYIATGVGALSAVVGLIAAFGKLRH